MIASCAGQNADVRLVGSSMNSVTEQLRISALSWKPAAHSGYEVSCALEQTVTLFGEQGTVCLVRRGDRLAALDFRIDDFRSSQYEVFRKVVIASFGLSDGPDRDVYVVRERGVVHLRPTPGGGAQLVVTDGAYADLYVKEQLRAGFVDLSNGLRPH
jgi:hypothetical protein